MNVALFESLNIRLPGMIQDRIAEFGLRTIVVEPAHLIPVMTMLREDAQLGYLVLADIVGVDYSEAPKGTWPTRYAVRYILRSLPQWDLLSVKVPVDDPETGLASLTGLFASANWAEREVFDQFGITFRGHPNLKRILNHHQVSGHPLRKDYSIMNRQLLFEPDDLMDEMTLELHARGYRDDEEGQWRLAGRGPDLMTELMLLNIGPSHPATHGTLRTLVALDGETITAGVSEIGYLHRGFEKTAENRLWSQVTPYTDRLNYQAAHAGNIGYAMAVEQLLGVEVPRRAEWIRLMLAELARIGDHLSSVAQTLSHMGALTGFWYLGSAREAILDFMATLTGSRFTPSFVRIGGVSADLHDGWRHELAALLKTIESSIHDIMELVEHNRIFHDRSQNVGVISASDAVSYGFTGPNLRATGVATDLRKDTPYGAYGEFDFDVPVGTVGDVYDRVMVRIEEIAQSIRMIRQVKQNMPDGPVTSGDTRLSVPDNHAEMGSAEALTLLTSVFRGLKVPGGETYVAVESPNGELGFSVISTGGVRPYRLKVRGPSFSHMSAFTRLIERQLVADAIVSLGSLNIVAGELDR